MLITLAISALVIRFGDKIDYDFMDYLLMPYSQRDATFIFMSEILVGCLGAVMDVVVTVVMTVDQISETAVAPGKKQFIAYMQVLSYMQHVFYTGAGKIRPPSLSHFANLFHGFALRLYFLLFLYLLAAFLLRLHKHL